MKYKKAYLLFCMIVVLLVCSSCLLDAADMTEDRFLTNAPGASGAGKKSPDLTATYTADGKKVTVVYGGYRYEKQGSRESFVYLDVTIDGVTETYVETAYRTYLESVTYTFNGRYRISVAAYVPAILQDLKTRDIVYLEKYRSK